MNKKILKSFNSSLMFSLFFIVVLGLSFCLFKITTLFAADPLTYKLLADLPGVGDSPTHGEYLKNAIKLIIGLATALAVLVMVYAGVFGYIGGAVSPGVRTEAKTRMWGALLGLTLALVSYLILNTINPDLLSLNLTVEDTPAPADP